MMNKATAPKGTGAEGGEEAVSPDRRVVVVTVLTWLVLAIAAAWAYVRFGEWSFQLFAFVYTRWLFMVGGVIVSLLAANRTMRRQRGASTLALIGISTGSFVVSEILARAAWGR